MADTIRSFMEEQEWAPEDAALHADLAGGFRHASMMMLLPQLLKYRHPTTAVLYSNRYEKQVENVTDIYRMFNSFQGPTSSSTLAAPAKSRLTWKADHRRKKRRYSFKRCVTLPMPSEFAGPEKSRPGQGTSDCLEKL